MIELDHVRFCYGRDAFQLSIPRFAIESGQRIAIVGPSGSGKTTLLALMAGIQKPEAGNVRVGGVLVSNLSDAARRRFRITRMGLIFQEFELLDYLSVVENILLPFRIHRALVLDRPIIERAKSLAATTGIGDKLNRPIRRLSQGERQRVAICRALIAQPDFLLADEPTGNLDPSLKSQTLSLLFDQADRFSATLIVVTHDVTLLSSFDRVVTMDSLATEGDA